MAAPTTSQTPGDEQWPTLQQRLRLGSGLMVVSRDETTTQIGSEPNRRTLVTHLPHADRVLTALDGARTAADVLRQEGADPRTWTDLLDQLLERGYLAASGPPKNPDPILEAERACLTERYGATQAEVLLGRRADAAIEIRGNGRAASSLAVTLAAAGIGHLYHRPHRTVRPADLLPPTDLTGLGPARLESAPAGEADARVLADRIASVSDRVQVRPVADHQRPTLVVLAGDSPADTTDGKILSDDTIAHLAVWVSQARAIVGPLVLPGLSSCLRCAELFRIDSDPGWPLIQSWLARPTPSRPAAAVLAAGAAALAAAEVLDFVDGVQVPASVDGTIEWTGGYLPRRRTWQRHPDCVCLT